MKASEHFDLPLEANQESIYQSDGTDEWVAEFNTPEQAVIAARAINHADKLADALEMIMDFAHATDPYDMTAKEYAISALAAYRSAK